MRQYRGVQHLAVRCIVSQSDLLPMITPTSACPAGVIHPAETKSFLSVERIEIFDLDEVETRVCRCAQQVYNLRVRNNGAVFLDIKRARQ